MSYEQNHLDRAVRELERVEARKAEQALRIRERLLAGYSPRRCMEEVTTTIRYREERRQCLHELPSPSIAFDGIVSFRHHHAGPYVQCEKDLRRARAEVEDARLLLRTATIQQAPRDIDAEQCGVYVVYDERAGRAKIGATTARPKRIAALRAGAAGSLRELLWVQTDDPYGLEQRMHAAFVDSRITKRGEWFHGQDPEAFAARARAAAEDAQSST